MTDDILLKVVRKVDGYFRSPYAKLDGPWNLFYKFNVMTFPKNPNSYIYVWNTTDLTPIMEYHSIVPVGLKAAIRFFNAKDYHILAGRGELVEGPIFCCHESEGYWQRFWNVPVNQLWPTQSLVLKPPIACVRMFTPLYEVVP